MIRSTRRRTVFATILVSGIVACSAHTSDHLPPETAVLSSAYTYKFFIETPVATTQVNVVPQEVANTAYGKRLASGRASTDSLGLHLLDTPVPSGSSVIITAPPSDLVTAAAAQCGMIADEKNQPISQNSVLAADPALQDIVSEEQAGQTVPYLEPVVPPWLNNASDFVTYYIFSRFPTSCDQVLEYEETMVCVADQLAQLADTISPLQWHAPLFLNNLIEGDSGLPLVSQGGGTWIMPPPSEMDKFIVRDIAISVLAHIPMMDSFAWFNSVSDEAPNAQFAGVTCSALYSQYVSQLTSGSSTSALESLLFGPNFTPTAETYPPNPQFQNSLEPGRTIVQERQAFEAGVLRSAGQLLHDLIRESVYSDLAGAAANAGTTSDQQGGQVAASGLSGNQPYDSLAHVARTLLGRWEMDVTEPDLMCHTVAGVPVTELNLFPASADPGTRARANDLGALTATQAVAETLFEESGIVVADGSTIDLGQALIGQLQGIKAANLGLGANPDGGAPDAAGAGQVFANEPSGQAIANLVSTLGLSDLARGAQHNRTTFSILTNIGTSDPTQFAGAAQGAGLTVSSIPNSALPSSAGIAIVGGLPRALALTDPVARAGALMVDSQCPEVEGAAGILFDDTVPAAPAPAQHPSYSPPFPGTATRQDVFALGNAIRSRLVKLREDADQSAPVTSNSTQDAQARAAAVAELGAWAGSGRMLLTTSFQDNAQSSPNAPPTDVFLVLSGISPSDFAVQQDADIAGQVSLIYGDAHLAECAANLTSNCSAAAVANVQWTGTFLPSLVLDPHTLASQYGVTGDMVTIDFSVANAPPAFAAALGANSYSAFTSGSPFQVVIAQDPTKAIGTGEVLGALQLPSNIQASGYIYGETSLNLSPMRRELLYDAFGLGKWVGAAPPQAGEYSSAGSPSFCVEGVPRDVFVPLQNDLTDSSDSYENSWSHYLSLAQAAATNADTLAQQLIDIGFQQTQNVENAAQQLLTETGTLPNVDDISIDSNGNINAGPSNGALGSVLSQATFDVVFFGAGPMAGNPSTNSTSPTDLSNAIGCAANPNNPLCARLSSNPTVYYVPATASGANTTSTVATWTGPPAGGNSFAYTALNLPGTSSGGGAGSYKCGPAVNAALAMKGVSQSSTGAAYSKTTLFHASDFAGAIETLDPGQVSGSLASLTMTMDDSPVAGHWSVTFNGVPVMDSDAPAPAWPSCLSSPSSCNFASQPVTAALNDMFRWCPGADIRNSVLGSCEGGGPTGADAELNAIRWRVEAALYLAAAMNGTIPEGMFSGPIPAANFPVSEASSVSAPIPIYFGNGSFAVSSTDQVTGYNTNFSGAQYVNASEFTALQQDNGQGAVVIAPPNSRYFHWGPNGSQQVPLWLLTIYAPTIATQRAGGTLPFQTGDGSTSQPYVHVFATTELGSVDYSRIANFLALPPLNLGIGLSPNSLTPAMWAAIGGALDTQQCASPLTNGTFSNPFGEGATNANWLQGLVASLKTDLNGKSDMRSKFTGGFESAAFFDWSVFGYFQYDTSNFEVLHAPTILTLAQWFDLPPVQGPSGSEPTNYWNPTFINEFTKGTPPSFASQVTPNQRLQFVLNSGEPQGNCDAAWQFTQAAALSCLAVKDIPNNLPPPSSEPKQLNSYSDLVALTAWMNGQLAQSGQALSNAYAAHVPAAVVANALSVPGSLTSASGAVGQDLAQASNALLNVYSDWRNVQSDAQTIANTIVSTQQAITQANIQQNQGAINLDIQHISAMKQIADDVVAIASGAGSIVAGVASLAAGGVASGGLGSVASGASQAVNGMVNIGFDTQVIPLINQLQQDNMMFFQNQINQDITNLNQQVNVTGTAMQNAMTSLREDVNNVNAGTAALSTDTSTVAYYAGKATGADVWNCGANPSSAQPVECVSHVNTVLNRRYDGAELRYQAALQNAKGLGYLARLSIEQRLGIRLSDITTPIGTLNPPSTWADDVCHLTGVNYQSLQGEIPDAGTPDQVTAADQTVAAEFADSFIGDYVQELTDFVTFYNVANPEQDGNDTAVLSLRESLLGGNQSCQSPSTNLLTDSSRLQYLVGEPVNQTTTGWVFTGCASSDANCMQANALGGFQLPAVPGGVTWLVDLPVVASTGDAGVVDSGVEEDAGGGLAGAPDDVATQEVLINAPGTYLLSWWDQAIVPSGVSAGQPSSTATNPYHVGVYDSAWTPVTGFTGAPTPSSDPSGAGWSPRHVVSFTVATPDVFHVVFGASASNAAPGSVAVSDIQLELATSSGVPSGYVDTNSSGMMTTFDCAVSPGGMLSQFQRNCDPDGTCHYDLTTPITISTQTMTSNGMSLAGKLATGNFNFRHIDVGVNVVGTGVIDCSGTGSPDCFGSGYVQYTLTHDGSQVGVLGFDNQYRTFDFGIASIDHGKALAIERYITTPIGSADQSLISQVLQEQFRGRPLDGVYHLSIFDSPVLNFNNIQDVQIVLNNYHYWSRVITSNNAN